MLNKMPKLLCIGIAAIGVTACNATSHKYMGVDTMKRSTVEHARLSHRIDTRLESGGLSATAKAQINAFLAISQARYGDVFSLDTAETPTSNTERQAIGQYLASLGVRLQDDGVITNSTPGEFEAVLVIDRYVATPPNCHGSAQTRQTPINQASVGFGCASRSNLGIMVANPRDLIIASDFQGASAQTASKAARDYRTGAPPSRPALSSPVNSGGGGGGGGGGGNN